MFFCHTSVTSCIQSCSLIGLKTKYCDRMLENLLFTFGCVFVRGHFTVRLWIRWRFPSSSAFLQSVCKLVRVGKKKGIKGEERWWTQSRRKGLSVVQQRGCWEILGANESPLLGRMLTVERSYKIRSFCASFAQNTVQGCDRCERCSLDVL